MPGGSSNRSAVRRLFRPRPQLTYIVDNARWSFYWDGVYLVRYLQSHCGLGAQIGTDPRAIRKALLHFGNRYAYLELYYDAVHPSNKLFLTWFHGDPADTRNGYDRLFTLLRNRLDRIERVVVPCRITHEALRSAGVPPEKLALIPLGVDLAVFTPPSGSVKQQRRAALGIPAEAYCIGSFHKDGVGWNEGDEPKLIKGPDIFVETMAALRRRHPDLFVVLTGPARGYVKNRLRTLGVPFVHHMVQHYPDLAGYYACLDAYLIPSRCEGGPKALLESWGCGVPVVATQVGMAADCIKHRCSGMAAPVDRPDLLAEYLTELREDTALRNLIVTEARAQVRQYDWSAVARQYYDELYRPFRRWLLWRRLLP